VLVLSRKQNESVHINGTEIRVVVVSIRGDKVRLGFDVPGEFSVLRSELLEGVQDGVSHGKEVGQVDQHQECGGNQSP